MDRMRSLPLRAMGSRLPLLVAAIALVSAAIGESAGAGDLASSSHRLRGGIVSGGGGVGLASTSPTPALGGGGGTIGESTPPGVLVGASGVELHAGFWHVVSTRGGPVGDRDGDGVGDAVDNCPGLPNADQHDTGGIGSGSGPDGVGDPCQCGDVTGDGRVTLADSIAISRSLLIPPTAVLGKPGLCDVGGSAGCTAADAVVVRRRLLVPPTATLGTGCGD